MAALLFAWRPIIHQASPRHTDVRITERLRAALALVDVLVPDHSMVGDQDVTSLATRGLV